MFLNGIDANYVPLMEEVGLRWLNENGEEINDIFSFLKTKSVNCLRVRIWVGESGPSRLPYVIKIVKRASKIGFKVQPTIFLSDQWSDLHKQPEPIKWAHLNLQKKMEQIRVHISEVMEKIAFIENESAYYQIGNEIDYGICGIFARDKKRRRNIEWLKRHIWKKESEILKEAIDAIKVYGCEKPIALHLGKVWDHQLIRSFM
jgi:arabinogalactan endo-1,4-beta-galactosidase